MNRRVVAFTAGVLVLVVGVGIWLAARYGLILTNPSVKPGTEVPVPSESQKVLASGLELPWGIAFLPDKTALITERERARILSVTLDGKVTEVQKLSEVAPGGEGGLLGIAVSTKYAEDRWVYVYYTSPNDNRVARLHLGEAPQPILTGIPKANIHNGGRIAFGPDGMLYAGTGDASDRSRSQNRSNLGGKILRITPEGKPAPGNPFGDSPVYSYGHRNVQGLAWDSAGRLFASEFGQNRYDELNRIEPGRNYGWPEVEGMGDDPDFTNPLATWAPADASPSGITILNDRVYMACLRGTKLYRIGLDGKGAQPLLNRAYGRLRAVTVAPDGSLWVITSNGTNDRLIRLVPPA